MEGCSCGTDLRPPNGPEAKLRGRGRAATRTVARRLPRIPLDSDVRTPTAVSPRKYCSAQGLQPRIGAGPRRLQLLVRRLTPAAAFLLSEYLQSTSKLLLQASVGLTDRTRDHL
jgi:hypothetical protein